MKCTTDDRVIPDWPQGYEGGKAGSNLYALTYYHHLCDEIARVSPKNVLEWGVGASTIFMAEKCPPATKIVSIDGKQVWIDRNKQYFEERQLNSNVEYVLLGNGGRAGKCEEYCSWPLVQGRKFDLIFIDGRRRADCIAIASLVLEDNGSVILHDSHRVRYHAPFKLFDTVASYSSSTGNKKYLTTVLRNPKIKLSTTI